jgi:hypothetical protein
MINDFFFAERVKSDTAQYDRNTLRDKGFRVLLGHLHTKQPTGGADADKGRSVAPHVDYATWPRPFDRLLANDPDGSITACK